MSNDRYKVLRKITDVFTNDIPIIVTEIAISEDSYTDKKLVKVTIKNIGLQTIESTKIFIEFLDNKGKSKEKLEFVYEDINLKSNSDASMEINIEFKSIDLKSNIRITVSEYELEDTQKIEKETILKKYNDIDILSGWGEIGEQYKREILSISSKAFNVKNKYKKINGQKPKK